MNSREQILGRVKEALAPLPKRAPLPDVPVSLFAPVSGVSAQQSTNQLWDQFAEALRTVHGTPVDSPSELFALLVKGGYTSGYCDPQLWPELERYAPSTITVQTAFDRARVDDYAFGITTAAGAIAATGTLILTDRGTSSRLGALAPWVHVAVLRPDSIFTDIASAVAALPADPNVVWVTGPSKTADVEGILIEGVHGPGIQIALRL